MGQQRHTKLVERNTNVEREDNKQRWIREGVGRKGRVTIAVTSPPHHQWDQKKIAKCL